MVKSGNFTEVFKVVPHLNDQPNKPKTRKNSRNLDVAKKNTKKEKNMPPASTFVSSDDDDVFNNKKLDVERKKYKKTFDKKTAQISATVSSEDEITIKGNADVCNRCSICSNNINSVCIGCSNCGFWFHLPCVNISQNQFDVLDTIGDSVEFFV